MIAASPLHAAARPTDRLRRVGETPQQERSRGLPWLLLLWLVVYVSALFRTPLLDDADATHAEAAAAMARTGDWITLHVNGIRYLEKPPLPYWLVAMDDRLFGFTGFSAHLPLAVALLLLALTARAWLRWAGSTILAADLCAAMLLTSVGSFLFTRVFIPDVLLSLLLLLCLMALQRATDRSTSLAAARGWAAVLWASLAAAVLTKGLVAIVFVVAAAAIWLWFSPGNRGRWRQLHPVSGLLLFLLLAAPWHILAGLRNRGGAGGHGFFWFYFINEHVLRFLGRRVPRDYNRVPWVLYWSMHLLWLFPWSAFAGVAFSRSAWASALDDVATEHRERLRSTARLLVIFSAFVLIFFSLSTSQEYYTLPVYAPLLMLLAVPMAAYGSARFAGERPSTPMRVGFGIALFVGIVSGVALALALWSARHLPSTMDIGDLLAHRDVGDYTLSTSHLFDLTGRSFAALRLPATMAAFALGGGLTFAGIHGLRGHLRTAFVALAASMALFLVAAHIAFVRFEPLLSSRDFAARIQSLEASGGIEPNSRVLLLGDQAYGSAMIFYLRRPVVLVNGRSTSMLFGSTFPDAPPVFWNSADLLHAWGDPGGTRLVMEVPEEQRAQARQLLRGRASYVLAQTAEKQLVTDRPLRATSPPEAMHGAH